jgi:hypothetical protein
MGSIGFPQAYPNRRRRQSRLTSGLGPAQHSAVDMTSAKLVSLHRRESGGEDTLWAVVASMGKRHRVAEVFRSHAAAAADMAWRTQQVQAYVDFLRRNEQPVPHYSLAPIKRTDLPRQWKPLPALGFLRGQFI